MNISFLLAFTLAWLGHFLVDMMIGIWPVFKTIAHLDLAIAGLIGGACALFGEGLQVVFGILSDKGYRKALILGGVLATSTSACFAYTDSYISLFLLYLLTCAGSGAFHPSAVSLVGDLSEKKRNLLISLFTSGGAFGMAASQIIYVKAQEFFNGHAIWLALPSLILVLVSIINPIAKGSRAQISISNFNLKVFVKFFSQKPLRLLYICQVCSASMLWGTMFLLPDLLISRGFEPWIAYGGGHMMFVLGSAVMMIPSGYLADRFSSRQVILTTTFLSLILLYLMLFFPLISNISMMSLLFCLGATIGAVNPIVVALGARFVPDQKGAIGAFLMGLVWCVSEGVSQAGGGWMATRFAEDGPAKALAILGLLFFVGLVAAYQLPAKEEALSLETAPSKI